MRHPSDSPRDEPGGRSPSWMPTAATPFGTVRSRGVGLPRGEVCAEPGPLPSGARRVRVVGEDAEVDVVHGTFDGSVPEGYPPLIAAWGVVWTVRAHRNLPAFGVGVGVDRVPSRCEAAPDEGQDLCAVSMDDGMTELTIGGEDDDALWRRAYSGDLFPRRWAREAPVPELGCEDPRLPSSRVLEGARGVRWRLPGLEAGEECVVHAAVAWSTLDPERPSTWFAVDVGTRWLLDELVSPRRDAPGSRR